jgi:hypothetical protein
MGHTAVSPAIALETARAAGIELAIDGDDLVLEAAAPPPAALLDLLSHHKAGIVMLLRPGVNSWSVEDWLAFFDEKAGIAEFDGGLSREKAEAHAYRASVIEWLDRNPAPSSPGHCAWCGRAESPSTIVIPFGTTLDHHTWLHAECWPAWCTLREANAAAALAAVGLHRPTVRGQADG